MTTYCGGFTSQGHGMNAVCGEPEWGPKSKIHQCAGCMIADLRAIAEWQPIETAPKDGSMFIGIRVLFTDDGSGSPSYMVSDARWQGGVYRFREAMAGEPEHWLPLHPPE